MLAVALCFDVIGESGGGAAVHLGGTVFSLHKHGNFKVPVMYYLDCGNCKFVVYSS